MSSKQIYPKFKNKNKNKNYDIRPNVSFKLMIAGRDP